MDGDGLVQGDCGGELAGEYFALGWVRFRGVLIVVQSTLAPGYAIRARHGFNEGFMNIVSVVPGYVRMGAHSETSSCQIPVCEQLRRRMGEVGRTST